MNAVVMTEAETSPPARALDVAAARAATSCGWRSAAGGWTASTSRRSPSTAPPATPREAGPEIDERVTWTQRDLMDWRPPEAAYDLVTVSFMHLPGGDRAAVYAALADAVAVGGTFLVAAHSPLDIGVVPRPHDPDLYFTAEELAAGLDDRWEIVTCEARPRPGKHPDGEEVTLHDTVLRARRVAAERAAYSLTDEYATTPRRSRPAASRATLRSVGFAGGVGDLVGEVEQLLDPADEVAGGEVGDVQDVVELVALGPAVGRPGEAEVGLVQLVEVVVALERVEVGPDRDHVGEHLLDLPAGHPRRRGVVGTTRLVDQGGEHRGQPGGVEVVPQPGAQRLGGEQVHLVVDPHQRAAAVGDLRGVRRRPRGSRAR